MVGYPVFYGEKISKDEDNKRLSNRVVSLCKNKRFVRYISSVGCAVIVLVLNAPGASASDVPLPGSDGNEFLKAATEGVPKGPAMGPFQPQAQLPNADAQNILRAMPMEAQQRIAAQQADGMWGMYPTPEPGGSGPTSSPSFYIPGKPAKVGPRAMNTVMFGTSVGITCLNAIWGEPVAIVMYTTGLTTMAYRLGKGIVLYMVKP